MNNVEAKKIIQTNISITESVRDYVSEYIDWVEKNIPDEFMAEFGIGVTAKHRQFGCHYGFMSYDEEGYLIYRSPSRNSYYIANDFNCLVKGSSNNAVKDFAKKIPELLEDGLEFMHKQNIQLSQILSKKVTFS